MICKFRFYRNATGDYIEKKIRIHGDGHSNIVQWAEVAEAFRCGYIAGTGRSCILMGVEERGFADADFDDRKTLSTLFEANA